MRALIGLDSTELEVCAYREGGLEGGRSEDTEGKVWRSGATGGLGLPGF
jgi:hypothetical protein